MTRMTSVLALCVLASCDTAQGKTEDQVTAEERSEKPAMAKAGEVDAAALAQLDEHAQGLAPTEARDGEFVFKFVAAKNPTFKTYEPLFQHGRLSSLVDVMKIVKLPRNIPVATLECGTPNAFYTQA